MIVQKDFLDQLKDFSLNSYEAKLWTALLSRGVSTAGELSDIAGVPRSRSYDVLESLEKKGFIIMKLGKPIKYIAVPPAEVIERLKKQLKEDADRQATILDGLRGSEMLNELNLLHKQGIELVEPTDLTGIVKGRNNLYNHLQFIVKNAQKSISIMTTETGFLRKAEALKANLQKAKDRGVRIRVAAPLAKISSQDLKILASIAALRNADGIKARFCIVDGKQAAVMVVDDADTHPHYDFGIWINTEFFATAMESIFDKLWSDMRQVK
ncbi:TrmB family transcriptional regulator [Candidatus Woesearchaeota archaeon]|nr:TrmB family transcriptional regulator [Candidatus Woesearchaeota archaeon]